MIESVQGLRIVGENLSMVDGEEKVLEVFRMYGVIPYQMLCLDRQIQAALADPIKRLIQKGLIVCEGRHDAYHLTPTGYAAVHGRAAPAQASCPLPTH